MRSPRIWLPVLLALAAVALPARAKFVGGEPVPLDRLLANVGRYVREHPREAEGHYTLGRIHGMAYASGGGELPVLRGSDAPGKLPRFPGYSTVRVRPDESRAKLTEAQLAHLSESIREYRRALELDPNSALYSLGLGWMCEQAYLAVKSGAPLPVPANKSGSWNREAEAAYRVAYRKSRDEDLAAPHLGPAEDASLAAEAGEGLLRMLSTHPASRAERLELEEVRKTLGALKNKPRAVTPILFPLDRPRPLSELLSPGTTTTFDLAGDDLPHRWPWVRPETAILVWDPEESGYVASGRQLFGSATWWIFWRNGYEALAALDDNGDGWLSGPELSGLSVWQDRNSDGRSDPGEVRPLSELGIEAIAVRAEVTDHQLAVNRQGLRLVDGRRLPTYDWTTLPARATGKR